MPPVLWVLVPLVQGRLGIVLCMAVPSFFERMCSSFPTGARLQLNCTCSDIASLDAFQGCEKTVHCDKRGFGRDVQERA